MSPCFKSRDGDNQLISLNANCNKFEPLVEHLWIKFFTVPKRVSTKTDEMLCLTISIS